MGFQPLYCKGVPSLLRAVSQAAHGNMTISGVSNCLNYCVISKCVHNYKCACKPHSQKCGSGPHNTTWWPTGWRPLPNLCWQSFCTWNFLNRQLIVLQISDSSCPRCLYRVSQEEWTKLRESVPYVELYRYNPKHLYPKLNGYGDNGHR